MLKPSEEYEQQIDQMFIFDEENLNWENNEEIYTHLWTAKQF